MKEINLTGQLRSDLGKKASKSLRKEGLIPCNMYGIATTDGKPSAFSFTVPMTELRKLIYTPHIYLVNLTVDGKLHTAIGLPVKLVGLAQGIRDGGRMSLSLRKLNVKAPYKSLPEHLDVDVTALTIGKSIKVGQLSYEGLELVTGKDVVVCSIKMTRAASMAAQAAKEGK